MKKIIFSLVIFFTLSIGFSQENKSNTINQQFNEMLESSNNYKDYKVIKETHLTRLQKNTVDKINQLNENIEKANKQIQQQQQQIEELKNNLATTNNNLTQVTQEKNQISFFGIPTNKGNYQMIMWVIIFVLFLVLAFFVYKYKSSHLLTKEAQENLSQTEDEFENFRKNALEKQQKLGRMLQDERNKLAKNKE